jgi:hypothetical protein
MCRTSSIGEMIIIAFEFQAKPHNGRIEIPAEYREKIRGTVRVIVLSQEQSRDSAGMIGHLLEHPLKVDDFAPITREEVHERS